METDQILDLFNISSSNAEDVAPLPPDPAKGVQDIDMAAEDAVDAEGNLREKGKRGFLDEIGELWDEKQYEEEYDLDTFIASMKEG
jgi:TATA-binding protein-associated factor